MNIGELVVNLGIKGADTAGKALKGLKDGLGEAKSMSLETKAAIVGVVYALERLMSHSAKMGSGLTNLNAATGLNIKELQQWQWAAQQASVSGDELAGSLKSIQTNVTNQLLGKGGIEGWAMVANKVGLDIAKIRNSDGSLNMAYAMGQFQKFAQQVPVDVGSAMLKTFGVTEGVFAGMRRNAFTPENLNKAPTYSDKEVSSLDKVNVAYANLGTKVSMAMGHFTSKHGMELVKDLTKLTESVLKLAEAFVVLAEKTKFLEYVGKALEVMADSMTLMGAVANLFGTDEERTKFNKEHGLGGMDKETDAILKAGAKKANERYYKAHPDQAPKIPVGTGSKPGAVNIEQNLNFQHDGKDHALVGDSARKATVSAFRQLQAQTQEA